MAPIFSLETIFFATDRSRNAKYANIFSIGRLGTAEIFPKRTKKLNCATWRHLCATFLNVKQSFSSIV